MINLKNIINIEKLNSEAFIFDYETKGEVLHLVIKRRQKNWTVSLEIVSVEDRENVDVKNLLGVWFQHNTAATEEDKDLFEHCRSSARKVEMKDWDEKTAKLRRLLN